MKEDKCINEKWTCLNNKMSKALKILGIIGIVLVVISLIVAFFGFLLRTNLFYAGISLLIFVLPAYFAVFLLIFAIAVIIEEKSKK